MVSGPALKDAPAETPRVALSAGKRVAESVESKVARRVFLGSEAAILITVLWQVWQHVLAASRMIPAGFQFDYEEGNILNTLVRISHGMSPYPDPHAFPNVLNPYGPVAYYLLAIPVKLLGVSFLWPRTMIAASVASICGLVALLLWKMTGSRLSAAGFGLMYAALMMVRGWSALLRVDFLALALITAGMYVFAVHCAAQKEDGRRASSSWWWCAAALLAAGLLTKHAYVAGPTACVMTLGWRRQWRDAVRFGGMMAGIIVAVVAAGAALTRGAMLVHIFGSHADPFQWSVYAERLARVLAVHGALVALAGVYLVATLVRGKMSAPALWLLLAAVAAITAGKLGSGWNHFLELPLAICLCAGLGWGELRNLPMRVLATGAAVTAMVFLALFLRGQRPTEDVWAPVKDCPAAYEFVTSQGTDRVLSENVGALVLGRKKVWISNLFVYSQLAMHAGWSDEPLRSMVSNRGFDFILTRWRYPDYEYFRAHGAERFSPAVIQAMGGNYHLTHAFQCTDANFVYEPIRQPDQAAR